MKNSYQSCVERLSKAEADLEEARKMLNYSILERVRLEKAIDWLADIADYYCGQDGKFCMRRCPLKSKDFRTGDVWCSTETSPELWREAARKATEQK